MRGIVTVNIGGEQRTLSLKNNFLVLMGIHLKCDPLIVHLKIAEIGDQDPLQALTIVTYCGLTAYQHRIGNYSNDLTFQQVAEWVDDANDQEFLSIWDEFSAIMGIPKASEKQIQEYEDRLKKNLMQMQPIQAPAIPNHPKRKQSVK